MKNPFKTNGFDSLIGYGITINGDTLELAPGTTTAIECLVNGPSITVAKTEKPDLKTTVVIAATGVVTSTNAAAKDIQVPNVTIIGQVKCRYIHCEGTLAIKAGARVEADAIYYRDLVIENGAVVMAAMKHLDHVSEGEQA